MDVKVLERKDNPLLERAEVKFRVAYDGATPSRQEVRKKLTAILNSDKSLTVIDGMKTDYGSKTATGYAKVYASEKALENEPKHVMKRNFPEEKADAKAAEAPAKPAENKESG